MIYLTGINRVLDLADDMGYTTLSDRQRFGLSLVLGGGEVKLLEHAAAFSTFSQDGIARPSSAILSVESQDGGTLFQAKENSGKRVMPSDIARTILDILSDKDARSYVFGSPSFLELPDRPAAAKTGTTNDYRDAWTLGATPSLTVGVWAGNNDNTPMKKGADGSKIAAPIWQSFMKKALKGKPAQQFAKPNLLPPQNPALNGEGIGEVTLKIDRASGKLATPLTPEGFVVEKKFVSLHDILHYVDKNNPDGPPPPNPASDPQYQGWEQAISEWALKQTTPIEIPPTESDDFHVPANTPTVSIITPLQDAKVETPSLSVEVSATAPRGTVARIELYLNGQPVSALSTPPYLFTLSLAGEQSGFHTITVAAYDDVDNRGEASVTINLIK
jgi:membrane peptidoglycan carboxypeptidase